MAPVNRFVAFKYKSEAPDERKRGAVDHFIKMYEECAHYVNHGPIGGQNTSPEWFKGFDVAFITQFKSDKARDQFMAGPEHGAFAVAVQDIVDDVFIYDFEDGAFGF